MPDNTAIIREALEGVGNCGQCSKCMEAAEAALTALDELERERSPVVAEIAAERRRQIEEEGWTPERDDIIHAGGGLALAAMGYCQSASTGMADTSHIAGHPPAYWPWDPQWWKPTSRRRDLIKAAALIVAEIERLDRAALKDDQ